VINYHSVVVVATSIGLTTAACVAVVDGTNVFLEICVTAVFPVFELSLEATSWKSRSKLHSFASAA